MNFEGWKNSKIKTHLINNDIVKHVCSECNQPPIWNNKPLILQLDHINGNKYDNSIENLRLLCPNCHTQTDTFSCRKLRYAEYANVTEDDLIAFYSSTESKSLFNFCIKLNLNYQNRYCTAHLIKIIGNSEHSSLSEIKAKFFKDRLESTVKHGSMAVYQQYVRNQNDEKYKNIINDILMNSAIDFSKFGWVNFASEIIGIKPQKVSCWMRRFMPEFYEDKCYKRKSRVV